MTKDKRSRFDINLQVAKNAYEVCRVFGMLNGDEGYPSWEEINKEGRQNIISAAEIVINNKKTNASSVHEAWIDLMISKGWSYGREYNEDEKTDPSMVPYSCLPPIQIAKDKLFHYTVKILHILNYNL